jgi:hypothetical protein
LTPADNYVPSPRRATKRMRRGRQAAKKSDAVYVGGGANQAGWDPANFIDWTVKIFRREQERYFFLQHLLSYRVRTMFGKVLSLNGEDP